MTTTYHIIFNNKRSQEGTYGVFTAPPIMGTGAKVFTNVWMSFPVPIGGDFRIDTEAKFFAWVGMAPSNPAPGVTVASAQSIPVVLGTDNDKGTTLPMVVTAGRPSFDLPKVNQTAGPGTYMIKTGIDFSVPNIRYLIGLAQPNTTGGNSPVGFMLANNNMETSITPVVQFYIAEYGYKPGTVVTFSEVSANGAKIDFSEGPGKGFFTAQVDHLPNGKFEVIYHPSLKE